MATLRPKKKPARKPEPEARLAMSIDGIHLSGERHAGRWHWVCPHYSDLVRQHDGGTDSAAMVEAFSRRAFGLDPLPAGQEVKPQEDLT